LLPLLAGHKRKRVCSINEVPIKPEQQRPNPCYVVLLLLQAGLIRKRFY
jgi:hypothetical protein